MTTRREDGQGGKPGDASSPPRDLIEFYRRWSEFRPLVVQLAGRSDLPASERDILRWVILLVDRISEHDLRP